MSCVWLFPLCLDFRFCGFGVNNVGISVLCLGLVLGLIWYSLLVVGVCFGLFDVAALGLYACMLLLVVCCFTGYDWLFVYNGIACGCGFVLGFGGIVYSDFVLWLGSLVGLVVWGWWVG